MPHEQSVMMAKELDRFGVEYELITIPNGPHDFDQKGDGLQDSDTARIFDRVVAFLDRYLRVT